MNVRIATLLLVAWVIASSPGTRAAESRYFVATSDAAVVIGEDSSSAVRVLSELQTARALMGLLAVNGSRPPVRVFAVANEASLRVLLPQYWEGRGARPPAASYMGPSSGFIAIRADIPAAQRFPLLLHEYVHVLTATRVPQAPAWLDEGLSEFWGASVIDRQQAVIGRPPAHHLKQLRARQWLTPDEIKQHQRGELEDNKTRTAMFYAQSWAMAHYLLLGRNPSAPLSFAPAEREWTPELDAGLRAYVTAGKFREVSAPAPEREPTTQVAQPLSEARALAERANMVLFGERPDAALPLAQKAVGLNPREPLALEVLGTYYFLRNQHAQSREWLTQALAADGKSYTSAFYLALMSASPAERERYLQLAVAANPEQPVAWQRLWILYRGDGRAEHARRWCTRVEPLLQPWLWLGPSFNCEA